jgi:hypothetical protein
MKVAFNIAAFAADAARGDARVPRKRLKEGRTVAIGDLSSHLKT